MKLSDFQNLTTEQLESMSVQDLKKLVSDKGKTLNKRISNIKYTKSANKSAVLSVEKSGGKFSVKGKTSKRALIAEAKREQHFMSLKSSTVSRAKAIQEAGASKVAGMTSKEYSKAKASEYKKALTDEKKAKSKTGKLTKVQKKSISKKVAEYAKRVKKEYDTNIGEAWDSFHEWKEENPAYAKSYSKEGVKQMIIEYASDMEDNDLDSLKNRFSMNVVTNSDDAIDDAVWRTVNEDISFDSGISPEQFMRMMK